MLQIGSRTYQLVRSQSGLHVRLDPSTGGLWQQVWRFEAHFVPADEDAGPALDGSWEYWRLSVNPMGFYRTTDWRDLAQFVFAEDSVADQVTFNGNIENLIHLGVGSNELRDVFTGDFRFIRREGYLFTCEFDGEISAGKDDDAESVTGEFRMMVEIPFVEATVAVPLNAGDVLATAKGIAAREIGLHEMARTLVRPYDPKAWVPRSASRGTHHVTLETPWRVQS